MSGDIARRQRNGYWFEIDSSLVILETEEGNVCKVAATSIRACHGEGEVLLVLRRYYSLVS